MLVRGERGTAKSTAVRGLAPLLPPVTAASGQAVRVRARASSRRTGSVPADAAVETRPAPLVELPLGATLDRLVGALDLGRALSRRAGLRGRAAGARPPGHPLRRRGQPAARPPRRRAARRRRLGRLARRARRGLGRARGALPARRHDERRGGRAAPAAARSLRARRRGARAPRARACAPRSCAGAWPSSATRSGSPRDWSGAEDALARAHRRGPRPPAERPPAASASCCASPPPAPRLGVDGVRGDIVSARAARALAALDGDDEVGEEHVRRAAALALLHRRRRDPLDGGTPSPDDVERALDDQPPDRPAAREARRRRGGRPEPTPRRREVPQAPARERLDAPGCRAAAGRGAAHQRHRQWPGRPARAQLGTGAGAIDSRAAARRQRPTSPSSRRCGRASRARIRSGCASTCAAAARACCSAWSWTPAARWARAARLARVKGALLELLRDAYARRDRVAVVAFRDREASSARAARARRSSSPRRRSGGCRPAAAPRSPRGSRWPSRSSGASRRATAAGAPSSVILTDGRVQDPVGAVRRAAASLGRAAMLRM